MHFKRLQLSPYIVAINSNQATTEMPSVEQTDDNSGRGLCRPVPDLGSYGYTEFFLLVWTRSPI